jgi:hypothetical protein
MNESKFNLEVRKYTQYVDSDWIPGPIGYRVWCERFGQYDQFFYSTKAKAETRANELRQQFPAVFE